MTLSKKYLCALPIILLSIHANASPVDISVPFINKSIPKEGLAIRFDTRGNQKAVCTFDNTYKAYLTYNGSNKFQSTFGGGQEFYFTNKGETIETINESLDQVHVDKKGLIRVEDPYNQQEGTVSCLYLPE